MSQMHQDMDDVDGAPVPFPSGSIAKPMQDYDNPKEQQHHSFYDSGLGSLGPSLSLGSQGSAAITEGLNRLHFAQQAHEEVDDGYNTISLRSFESPTAEPAQQTQEPIEEGTSEPDLSSVFDQDEDGDTKLHIAIAQSKQNVTMNLIKFAPSADFLSVPNEQMQTPLHLAVVTNQPKVVRRLVVSGAALDARDKDGNTPLHVACVLGHGDCVEALTVPPAGSESLSLADLPFVQIPQDLDTRNYDGFTCMHLAASHCHVVILAYLYKMLRADVNARDGLSGRTVLHHVVDAGRGELVHFLLRACGADPQVRSFDGCTPLQLALGRGNEQIAELLTQYGAVMPASAESSSESDLSTDDEMMDSLDDCEINIQSSLAIST